MKAIESFGGWILHKGWAIFIPMLIVIPIAVEAYTGGKTSTVSSKEFVCTATSAVGIEPRCDQYTRVSRTNLTEKQ